jgi:catechol 2,3-dioxygenase-like lactoylglutathione lyase family enzyme
MLPLTRIDHIRLRVSDPERAERFYRDILGLDLLGRTPDGGAWLGGRDGRFALALSAEDGDGNASPAEFGYEVDPAADLEDLARKLRDGGVVITKEPGEGPRPGADGFSVSDPAGNIVWIISPANGNERPNPAPGGVEDRPISPRKLGHVVIKVADRNASEAFYQDKFGLRVTEYNQMGLAFFRCGPDHHDLGLLPMPEGRPLGLHHYAFDIGNTSEVARAERFLKERGVKIKKGPGFWNQGHHIEIYFLDPDGHALEIYCNIDQYAEAAPPETTASFYTPVHFGESEVPGGFQKF